MEEEKEKKEPVTVLQLIHENMEGILITITIISVIFSLVVAGIFDAAFSCADW